MTSPINVQAPWFARDPAAEGFPPGSPGNERFPLANADGVRPAWFGGSPFGGSPFGGGPGGSAGGTAGGFFSRLAGMLQGAFGRSGGTTFRDVTLGSTGDPHLSVNGTARGPGGTSKVDERYDSMTGHGDLFSTTGFGDGFSVATTVTAPGANGVTQNATATATMNGGSDSVTMTNTGLVSVTSGGAATSLAPGQTLTLSGGATVTESANGAVTIAERRGDERLATTFAENGTGGVDVTARGHDVTLSGDLIAGV
jgi:hypothetical protein